MESLVHYSNPSHAPSVLGLFNEQRLRGQMCDVVLLVADQRYQAHRTVLAASSEYFQSLFTGTDAEALKVVQLDFCEPDAFEIVLNYIYSSSLFVDKGSLAAIQELGYSLGIPFLTNIASTRPHVSYCVSRKRQSFSEEDENDAHHTRSVIVHQVRNDTSIPSRSNSQRKTEKSSSPRSNREPSQLPSKQNSHESIRHSESMSRKSSEKSEGSKRKSTSSSHSSILKGNPKDVTSVRPQLTSSVSFSDVETQQHVTLQTASDLDTKREEEEEETLEYAQLPFQDQTGEPSQRIDRSGPLIKSLLRRSLSMDSPVPVFSPTLELKELQTSEQSVVKMASKASDHNGSSKRSSPLGLRSKYPSVYDEETQVEREVRVKSEPSSPLADPLDIIRITVGDRLPVNLKDLQTNSDEDFMPDGGHLGKRKGRADNRRYPFKKAKGFKEHPLPLDESTSENVPHTASADSNENTEEPGQNKMFKCWSCLKVFRSSAGLHRHVNMYHNPEKPYACEICHKRFHTNFKVWTHSQTQHGVVQNPASSSSTSVLDEKFQKKLIDIVREREIKKALLWKLKRNKQGLQSPTLAKKRTSTSFICPYCGKVFLLQIQYKQHVRTHRAGGAEQHAAARENVLSQEQGEMVHQENTDAGGGYACRLCNEKLSSRFEQSDHERDCRHATVCPYCRLRFSCPTVKKDHEAHCKYKKLTCLECMRTFKSSFSIWRHQVEVHNHNMMTVKDQMNLEENTSDGEASDMLGQDPYSEGLGQEPYSEELEQEPYSEELGQEPYSDEPLATVSSRENIKREHYSDSSAPGMYDSEDSVPEDLSIDHQGRLVVKEEPMEEAVSEMENTESANARPEDPGVWHEEPGAWSEEPGAWSEEPGVWPEEPGVWPCEKCGNLFSSRKDLERHQELLCHIKPFSCHICNKAFRTNFRLWSHFQSHMASGESQMSSGDFQSHMSSGDQAHTSSGDQPHTSSGEQAHMTSGDQAGAKEIDRRPSSPSPSPPMTPQTSGRPSRDETV